MSESATAVDSRATAAETARYEKRNPTKAEELYSSTVKGELEFLGSNGLLESSCHAIRYR